MMGSSGFFITLHPSGDGPAEQAARLHSQHHDDDEERDGELELPAHIRNESAGKIPIGAFDVGRDSSAVAPRHGPDLEVFLDGLGDEGAASLRYVGNAKSHDVFGRPSRQRLAAEPNVSGGVHHAGNCAQGCGLAGAIGAEQGGDATFGDLKIKPEQHLGGAVESAKPSGLQQHRSHHFAVPRYAAITSGSVRTSAGVPSAILRPKSSTTTLSQIDMTRFM